MTIAVISAMESEISAIRDRFHSTRKETVSSMPVDEADVNGVKVYMTFCGEGKSNAAACTEMMILKYAPDAVLFTGVAGGIAPELNAGDMVVGDRFVQHDYDMSPIGYEKAYIINQNGKYVYASEKLSDLLYQAASEDKSFRVMRGTMATGDQFVNDAGLARSLYETYDALSVDMESAVIAHICYLNNVPCTVLRAISDKGDGVAFKSFPEFLAFAVSHTVDTVEKFVSLCKTSL